MKEWAIAQARETGRVWWQLIKQTAVVVGLGLVTMLAVWPTGSINVRFYVPAGVMLVAAVVLEVRERLQARAQRSQPPSAS
jgi:hypothetical protein